MNRGMRCRGRAGAQAPLGAAFARRGGFRAPKGDTRYEYRLLATLRIATLQKEVIQAQAEGYVLVGMVSRKEHMVIMEKQSPANE